jgi:hypothetical protein
MSNSDIVLIIPAGVENLPVRAVGDFIFLKESARDIKVTVSGQSILMRRGDKRRFDRESVGRQAFETFEVSNNTEFDIRVVFVVGEGDYSSQVVTGELSIAEKISSFSLNSLNLPVVMEKELGLVSAAKTVKTKNTVISETTGYGPFYSAYYYKGRVVGFGPNNSTNMHVFDSELNYLSDHPLVFSGSVGNWSIAGACTNGKHAYVLFSGNATQGNKGIWVSSVLSSDFVIAAEELQYKNGIGVIGDVLYVGCGTGYGVAGNAGKLLVKKYDINSDGSLGSFSELWIDSGGTGFDSIDVIGGEIFVSTGSNMASYKVFSIDGSFLRDENVSGVSGIFYLDDSRGVFYDRGTVIKRKAFKDLVYSCRLYVQDVGDVGSRKEFDCLADVSVVGYGAGSLMVGEIAAACIQSVSASYQLRDGYLDYLVSLEYNDGDYIFKKDAGTSTWAYRGFVDFGEMVLESKFTIKLMPEYLSGAV